MEIYLVYVWDLKLYLIKYARRLYQKRFVTEKHHMSSVISRFEQSDSAFHPEHRPKELYIYKRGKLNLANEALISLFSKMYLPNYKCYIIRKISLDSKKGIGLTEVFQNTNISYIIFFNKNNLWGSEIETLMKRF